MEEPGFNGSSEHRLDGERARTGPHTTWKDEWEWEVGEEWQAWGHMNGAAQTVRRLQPVQLC